MTRIKTRPLAMAIPAKDGTRSEFIGMRVSPELKQALQEKADKQNRSLTNYIETVLLKDVEGGE